MVGDLKAVASPLRAYFSDLYDKYASLQEGNLANYIPELSRADPSAFGLSLVTVTGQVFVVGQAEQLFTIQSVSKPFVYGLALEDHGREEMLRHVGVEPTGDPFNSFTRLERADGKPFNPLINAGAIATTSMIKGDGPAARFNRLLDMLARYIGHPVPVDMPIFTSERATGHRNRAIAWFLMNCGHLGGDLDEALDLYFKQCSVLVTGKDLAMMGATLAAGGVNPMTGERALQQEYVQDLLSVMYSCGMYDYSGEWAYRVGLPAKSGVGGGICIVIPGVCGIGTFSPLLDPRGNSVRGLRALEQFSTDYKLHVFNSADSYQKLRAAITGRALVV